MKKLSMVSLACATALAIFPAALAGQTTYSFNFSSPTITITGGLMTVSDSVAAGTTDGYDILSFTGDYSDTLTGLSGAMSMSNPGVYGSPSSPVTSSDGLWYFSNLLFPNSDAPIGTADVSDSPSGILFDVGSSEVNIAGIQGRSDYLIWESTDGAYSTGPGVIGSYGEVYDGSGSTLAITDVPEYNSLSMVVLCGFGLAGGFLFKAKQSGVLLSS
jgi:hypothetical protein